MRLFNKKSELVKSQEELQVVNGRVAELNSVLGQYNTMLAGAKLELELEPDASTKKRVKKLEDGIKKITAEIEEHSKRAGELQIEINSELARQRQEEIELTAEKDLEVHSKVHRARLLERFRDGELRYLLQDNGIGMVGSGTPRNLLKLAGVKSPNFFSADSPEQKPFLDMWNEKTAKDNAESEKEYEELVAHIKRYLKIEE